MFKLPSAVARFFEEKVGWHRFGVALSFTIIGVAAFVLYRKLQGISVGKVVQAMTTVEYRDVLLAALCVAVGYCTLTFYDLFALRTIGRKEVPYRVAALAGFTSYAVGHNVGASVFTGGAVRYHIYSSWGLNAVEVAKICFIAGLTFWLGNAAILGLGITYEPWAAADVNQLPVWFNRGIGIFGLLILLSYIAWVWRTPRMIGRHNWQVQLPGGPLTLLQVVLGIFDMGSCAVAMYMLVPNEPQLDFVAVSVVFVSATLLGFLSHSPGGLGVFDAAMLIALSEYDAEELLAGLLIFRLLYYITPFVFALVILGSRELILSVMRTRKSASK